MYKITLVLRMSIGGNVMLPTLRTKLKKGVAVT